MEFYIDVSFPSFPFSEKPAIYKDSMQATLSNTQPHSPGAWLQLVRQRDPDRQYVVTAVSHYKEHSPFPDFQHEYILLFVQDRTPSFQPTIAPLAIRVSRSITNHSLPARLGLWGPADDTVAVLGVATTIHLPDERLFHLTWTPGCAPSLERVSTFILGVHRFMPQYCLLKTSCYTFARALSSSIHARFNSITQVQQPRFLTRRSYFMHCIPVGITRAQRVANMVLISDEVFGMYF